MNNYDADYNAAGQEVSGTIHLPAAARVGRPGLGRNFRGVGVGGWLYLTAQQPPRLVLRRTAL